MIQNHPRKFRVPQRFGWQRSLHDCTLHFLDIIGCKLEITIIRTGPTMRNSYRQFIVNSPKEIVSALTKLFACHGKLLGGPKITPDLSRTSPCSSPPFPPCLHLSLNPFWHWDRRLQTPLAPERRIFEQIQAVLLHALRGMENTPSNTFP
jgi:hypothetical protein